jgi:hypothetical protein
MSGAALAAVRFQIVVGYPFLKKAAARAVPIAPRLITATLVDILDTKNKFSSGKTSDTKRPEIYRNNKRCSTR